MLPRVGGQGHVLVVDDDQSLRLLCRVNLELDGFSVTEARSLDAAREAVDGVDAVLLDVHVGAENGIDLLEELKRDRPDLPVVLLTGESGLPQEARGRADAVLSKPFEIRELTATIARVVA
jgi:two-component system nitrogen regulation response regulator GlnG